MEQIVTFIQKNSNLANNSFVTDLLKRSFNGEIDFFRYKINDPELQKIHTDLLTSINELKKQLLDGSATEDPSIADKYTNQLVLIEKLIDRCGLISENKKKWVSAIMAIVFPIISIAGTILTIYTTSKGLLEDGSA
jgi:hypothetical protein